ncbi:FAD-binding oxidoreductase [Rhodohalobacter halophilus]|uniref:FAD-binding oxidoreductase n=1 Tax=Rhodohalobacter halophilus TaxID=1812810 RepID=UPI00083FD952|nr:FAD-binding oxidoreductase [Rhodohalobacter halophilus]
MAELTLPEVELNIYGPKDPVEVTVVENYVVTKESSPNFVRHITFDISGTDLEGRVQVGQSIGILPPGKNEKGRDHKLRLYSVSSPTAGENGQRHLISTTVKRTIEEIDNKLYVGVASNYLADLQPGDKVKMTGPSGKRFLLPENAKEFNYLFFATGTGIAPFRGMIMELFEKGDYQNDCALIFGCPYRTDLLYSDYFEQMASEHSNFHYLKSISRENRRKDGSKHYVQTKLTDEEELLFPILKKENTLIYICGLKGMETGIYIELLRLGLEEYLDIRKKLPEDLNEIPRDKIKRFIKPSDRTFEEVY